MTAAAMCAPGAAAFAEKTRWREAHASSAQLAISMRERFEDKPGLVQVEDDLLNPIVVARAQAVGTPQRDPGAPTIAIIAAIVLGIVLLVARRALRRARRPAAERRGTRVARPPPARRGPTPTAPRSPRAPTRRPPPATVAKQRCRWHNNKVVYATQAEAQDWVDYTRRRDAAGTWEGQPMDHCYECPAVGGHWHVTKQPRRSW